MSELRLLVTDDAEAAAVYALCGRVMRLERVLQALIAECLQRDSRGERPALQAAIRELRPRPRTNEASASQVLEGAEAITETLEEVPT